MDPTDQEPRSAPVQQTVTQQGILLGQHDANIRALISANQTLAQQVASLSAQLASLQAPAAPTDQRNQPETGDDQQRDLQARERLLPGLKQGSLGGLFPDSPSPPSSRSFAGFLSPQLPPSVLPRGSSPSPRTGARSQDYTPGVSDPGGRGGLDRGRVVCRLLQWAPLADDVSAVPLQFPPRFLIPPGGPPPNSASRAPESQSVPTPEEPMQVGGAHLSPEERNRRLRAATVCFQLQRFSLQALIDSGAEENFIDEQAAEQAGIPSEPLERPRNALAVDGRILAQGKAPTPHSPLIEPVDLSGVPPATYHDLQEVFNKDKALSLPPHRPYDCAIELLPDAPLPSSRLYNLTRPEQEAMEGYINDSMAAGIIRPSTSPVGAGFFFVKKKDSSLRPCIDFRGLNNITTSTTPTTWCGSGRGTNGRQPSTPPWANFEYLVMPFGLTNAPAVFQALINDVLRDFLNRFVFVYLDDILIYSRNLPDHQLHVRHQVLQRLLENRLFVKKEKCEFHASQVDFLGFIIKEGCVQADPAKVRAVAEWPIPTNRKLLQRFLGFANFYRRFIRNYSQEAAPLTALTSPSRPFVWSEEAEKAFNRLRTLFTTAPVLVQPDPAQQFVVEVDASDIGVGAVLSQRRGSDGRLHPCAFFSRRLSPAEANYDVR
ncbi:hypothetical protein L3Q82_005605 [Scortum barcoo]|uniref:Uncharacterized protein n=1 Tax=Scortum barcoo TaxID=214431 RepID=A0ACB8V870_9TELE|nr:hypothetical protein L3Q82_005605 [Scortum barcoo]